MFRPRQTGPETEEAADALRAWRAKRFRILVCVNGTEASYAGLKHVADIGKSDECDIIFCYVRPIDQGLRTGGLQVRVARENLLDWGLDLPGVRHLKRGLETLMQKSEMDKEWSTTTTTEAVWGDPLGDTKTEYTHENGRSIVLKLKVAPDEASGILDQYELGPYNLMVLGEPSRWRTDFWALWAAGTTQKIALLAPSSVLVARPTEGRQGYLICTRGSEHCREAIRRAGVLAHHCGEPITLISVAETEKDRPLAEAHLIDAKKTLEAIGISVAETRLPVGQPTQEIIAAGRDHALIVVSDRHKSRLKLLFSKSISLYVMGKSDASVLNVR